MSGRRGYPRSTGSGARRWRRRKWGAFRHKAGARYDMTEDPDGEWGDAWYYDGKLIYVHKRFVAIPAGGDDRGRRRHASSSTART